MAAQEPGLHCLKLPHKEVEPGTILSDPGLREKLPQQNESSIVPFRRNMRKAYPSSLGTGIGRVWMGMRQ